MDRSRRGGNQFVQIFETDGRERFARFGGIRPDVAADKRAGLGCCLMSEGL